MLTSLDEGYLQEGRCVVHDGANLCNRPLEDNLLWCPRHCKLQQKAYRCYKLANLKLDAAEDLNRIYQALISKCDTMICFLTGTIIYVCNTILSLEKHLRSVAYLRFPLNYAHASKLINTTDPELVVWSWVGAAPLKCNIKGDLSQSGLLEGASLLDLRSLRTTTTTTDGWMETFSVHTAESVEEWGKELVQDTFDHAYVLPGKTLDILVVNMGSKHASLSILIDKIIKLLGPRAVIQPNKRVEKELHDDAFDMARSFFREGQR